MVDTLLETISTIGLLLCCDKNNIEVESVLRDMNKPIGGSEYTLINNPPENMKGTLPIMEEIKQALQQLKLSTLSDSRCCSGNIFR
jgi:hypothetical protein